MTCADLSINIANFERESTSRELNALQKEIGVIKKAKGDATELLAKKAEIDKKIVDLTAKATALIKQRDVKAGSIGNIVDSACHVATTEVIPKLTTGPQPCVDQVNRTKTRSSASGTRNPITRATPLLVSKQKTRRPESFLTMRFLLVSRLTIRIEASRSLVIEVTS